MREPGTLIKNPPICLSLLPPQTDMGNWECKDMVLTPSLVETLLGIEVVIYCLAKERNQTDADVWINHPGYLSSRSLQMAIIAFIGSADGDFYRQFSSL